LCRWLRLRRDARRGRGCDNCPTGRHLSDGLRCCDLLDSWSCCYRDATSHNGGSGDAEARTRDEIAASDHRASMLFSWLSADRLGRLVAC
jgi:hypothetical protein